MLKRFLKLAASILRDTFNELMRNDPLRMAGATAFFATFALPPIIIIIVRVFGLFFGRHDIGRNIFNKLTEIIGPESADQVLNTIRSFRALQHNWLIAATSFIFLLFVATTLFHVIKSSLNQLWDIRIDAKRNFKFRLSSRLHSIVIILLAGVLFLGTLLADALQAILGQYFLEIAPHTIHNVNILINESVTIAVTTIWFFVLFIYLPDGRPYRPVAMIGAFLTALLFRFGRFLIGLLLSQNNIGTIYGTSGAMVFLLLFVFYSSIILYFGATFTKVLGRHHKHAIKPLPYAARIHISNESDNE